ncbi:MAG: hypothetical protein QOH70_3284, partial [Blastocatellia bacterium]|nr:hypothetical protein [Blastocatellia bacterium]
MVAAGAMDEVRTPFSWERGRPVRTEREARTT